MIVVIDPEVKRLFFDRIMESCDYSEYDASRWIESVAFGERTILVKEELDGFIQRIQELEKETAKFRRAWVNEERKRKLYQSKLRGFDNEIDDYLTMIEEYKSVLRHSGLGEYV
jgi:tRNA G10  N-methylase Trm11